MHCPSFSCRPSLTTDSLLSVELCIACTGDSRKLDPCMARMTSSSFKPGKIDTKYKPMDLQMKRSFLQFQENVHFDTGTKSKGEKIYLNLMETQRYICVINGGNSNKSFEANRPKIVRPWTKCLSLLSPWAYSWMGNKSRISVNYHML